jgi:predicted GNAT family acetyltransferase
VKVEVHRDPQDFHRASGEFLSKDPWSSSVVASVAERIAGASEPGSGEDIFISVEEEGLVVGVAMHTPPHALFLSRMPATAAEGLAQDLAWRGRQLPGVNGALGSTSAFARAWFHLTGRRSRLVRASRLYRLHALASPRATAGHPAAARAPEGIELVSRWLRDFHDEATPQAPTQDWPAAARRRLAGGEAQLWWDDGLEVAMACFVRTAAAVARVGPVFTPPQFRRRGYGAAVTAAAVRAALLAGSRDVVLYTDLANPTSNSIYVAIGFRPDHDAQELRFS